MAYNEKHLPLEFKRRSLGGAPDSHSHMHRAAYQNRRPRKYNSSISSSGIFTGILEAAVYSQNQIKRELLRSDTQKQTRTHARTHARTHGLNLNLLATKGTKCASCTLIIFREGGERH